MARFLKPAFFVVFAVALVTAAVFFAFQQHRSTKSRNIYSKPLSTVHTTQPGKRPERTESGPDGRLTDSSLTELKIIKDRTAPDESVQPYGPVDEAVTMRGTIETESGGVVPNETIVLYSESRNLRYSAISNDNGEFVFTAIKPAADFSVSVSPRKSFQRYQEQPVNVGLEQKNLKIVLKALPVGELIGVVVDVHGNPVPDFEFTLRSDEKFYWSAKAVSDAAGLFKINQVPKGRLDVNSRSGQLLDVKGFRFDPESTSALVLAVDTGPYSLRGHVYDEFGQPYAGAHVFLFWSMEHQGVRSRSTRQVTADPSGAFMFDGLGAGEHELVVSTFSSNAIKRLVNLGVDPGELNINLQTVPEE